MRKLIYIIFLLILVAPLLAEEFTLKKSFNDKPIFDILQVTAWTLIDLDTICTYNSIWNYGLEEANPLWKPILDKPALVFALDMVIKAGIIWGTSKIYKKNKYVAYFLITLVNIVQARCIYLHLRAWRKYQ